MILQVPDIVLDKNSLAWNGGVVYISTDEVGAAYLAQFHKDFSSFLTARAHEMVAGGCMFICLVGRTSNDIKEQGAVRHISHHMEAAFEEIIHQVIYSSNSSSSMESTAL